MSSLADVKRGDTVVMHTITRTVMTCEVTAAGPVWITAKGTRFRRDTGRIEAGVAEPYIETEHEHAEHTEVEELTRRLRPWGILPAHAYGSRVTLPRLRALAWLAERWENGEDAPEGLKDSAFGRTGCVQVSGEDPISARHRGSAAECAQDAFMLLVDGNADEARRLLESALYHVERYQERRAQRRDLKL